MCFEKFSLNFANSRKISRNTKLKNLQTLTQIVHYSSSYYTVFHSNIYNSVVNIQFPGTMSLKLQKNILILAEPCFGQKNIICCSKQFSKKNKCYIEWSLCTYCLCTPRNHHITRAGTVSNFLRKTIL